MKMIIDKLRLTEPYMGNSSVITASITFLHIIGDMYNIRTEGFSLTNISLYNPYPYPHQHAYWKASAYLYNSQSLSLHQIVPGQII